MNTWVRRCLLFSLTLAAAAPMAWGWSSSPPRSRRPKPPAAQSVTSEDIAVANSSAPADSDPIHIRVVGREFRWHFDVVGKEGENDKAGVAASLDTRASVGQFRSQPPLDEPALPTNFLELAAGHRIRWEVTSDDYVYWLRVPELELNVMAVPELTFWRETPAAAPGLIDLTVDPLCGFRFYHDAWMGQILVVESTP